MLERTAAMDPLVRSARISVAMFLALVVLGTAPIQYAIARSGQPIERMPLHVLTLMWIPGFASMLVRLVRREGPGDVSFRWGGPATWRAIAIVIAYPTLVGAFAYGAAWLTGLAHFKAPGPTFAIHPSTPAAQFALRYAVCLLPGIPLSLILVSGLVWGLWHVPLILTGQYAAGPSPLLSSVVFVASVIPAAYLFGWARLVTGSVWPAAIAHAAWNSVIQGAFDVSTVGASSSTTTNVWVGESGLLVAGLSVVGAWLVLRKPYVVLARPLRA